MTFTSTLSIFHWFDILPCILLHYLLFLTILPLIFIFLSRAPRGSSVITIFFGMRISFHRGTAGGRVGGSSGHARVLVSRTMWLCSRERLY